jgi:hypothetical protein
LNLVKRIIIATVVADIGHCWFDNNKKANVIEPERSGV